MSGVLAAGQSLDLENLNKSLRNKTTAWDSWANYCGNITNRNHLRIMNHENTFQQDVKVNAKYSK